MKEPKRLEHFLEDWQDERIHELQELIKNTPRYQPKPGDADYLTPEQIKNLLKESDNFIDKTLKGLD